MFMAPESWRELYENTLAQVKSGDIPRDRLEDAVRRILRVKFRLGLFEKPAPSKRPLAGNYALLGAPEHLALARQAVRESLVLLKNQSNLLPLRPNQRVLVAGDGADNIGKQCGGWTLSWQGSGNSNDDFPNGTSIWEGIRAAVTEGGGEAILSADGSYSQTPDVAIVVFGEDPYAEFKGDVQHLGFGSKQGLNLLKSFKRAEIPTIAIFLSGRPLWVNPEINAADAFVAAWLPGTQGAGIADVLFRKPDGSVNSDFKGKLSYSWPSTAVQASLDRGEFADDPLFPYGYGLTYTDSGDLARLSEASGLTEDDRGDDVFFAFGDTTRPWTLLGNFRNTSYTAIDALTRVGHALTIRSVDRVAQEDAKQFVWSGRGTAAVEISGPAADYTNQLKQDMAIAIQYSVDAAPQGPVTLFVECGDNCRTTVDVTELFTNAELGTWTQTDIKLSCLGDAGADLSNLTAIFGLETADEFAISVSDVRLVRDRGQAICPDTSI